MDLLECYNYEYKFDFSKYEYIDWNGNSIERTPLSYPYSFEEYVLFKKRKKFEHAVYSDRLKARNYTRYNELLFNTFGNYYDYFDTKPIMGIEQFLQEYLEEPNLELIGIVKGCNASSGFPYWVFLYNKEK